MKKIAIIGAGPAGLTAAYSLCKQGFDVEVFEASNAVGGMAKTIPLWGQLVDLGPHRFFSNDSRVNSFWLEVIGKDYCMVKRLTRIYYRKTFFDYPLKAFNALSGLGPTKALVCILSFAKYKLLPIRDESTFEQWVTNRFGRHLYKIFFEPYSEKLWGISCKELDADFAAQRIKKLSLYEAIKSALFQSNQIKHKTLVDEFAYPNKGAGEIYNMMANTIYNLGGKIHLNSPIKAIELGESELQNLTLSSGKQASFNHIISSMPITQLVTSMDAPVDIKECAKSLKFRNTILVYLQITGINPFPDQWIYVHSPDLKTGRITNFSNWVKSINCGQKETILCLEYWCYDEDPIWSDTEKNLVELATHEIYSTGLIKKGTVTKGSAVRVPKCYPVYQTGYAKKLRPIQKYLSQQKGLSVIGRYGSFKYNNQDHSILMGLLAAENISLGSKHNLWDINTDYEYQESSRITSTGLSID